MEAHAEDGRVTADATIAVAEGLETHTCLRSHRRQERIAAALAVFLRVFRSAELGETSVRCELPAAAAHDGPHELAVLRHVEAARLSGDQDRVQRVDDESRVV